MKTAFPRRRHLQIENVDDITIVTFTDEKVIDEFAAQIIAEQLFSLIDESDCRKMLLDCSGVTYWCSAMIGRLITLQKKVDAVGARLVFCNVWPAIYEVFEVTRLNKMFTCALDEQNALKAFASYQPS